MKKIELREVGSRKELRQFVEFPFTLYHRNAFWCPPLKSGEIKTLRITVGRTHPQLEDNLKAISIWKNYNARVHVRRRCWIREI